MEVTLGRIKAVTRDPSITINDDDSDFALKTNS